MIVKHNYPHTNNIYVNCKCIYFAQIKQITRTNIDMYNVLCQSDASDMSEGKDSLSRTLSPESISEYDMQHGFHNSDKKASSFT